MKILVHGHTDFEKKFNIKFFKPEVHKHSNGFISVMLDWMNKGNEEFYKFKYANLTHRSYGGSFAIKKKKYFNIVSASFEFEETNQACEDANITPWFNVSIAVDKEDESFGGGYDYIFFENRKYGIVCWFAPQGWEDWANAELIKV